VKPNSPGAVRADRPSGPVENGVVLDAVPLRRPNGTPLVGRSTMRALVSIAEAVFSRDGTPPAADRLTWVERETEDFLARSGARSRFMFSFMIWLTTWLAPILSGRFSPLYALPLESRVRALAHLEERFSEPLLAVKAILCLVYYEHPDAARDVGFDGRCLLGPREEMK
jgi:hypothetical protein